MNTCFSQLATDPYYEASQYHANRPGWFAVLVDNRQTCYRLAELNAVMTALPRGANVYVSQSEFRRPFRRVTQLARLTQIFADLETYKSSYAHLAPKDQARALVLHCEHQGVPVPSQINYSGRGLHAKWLFDDPIPAQALPRWIAVVKAILKALGDFCSDLGARDPTRCLRVIGTTNPRSGDTAAILWQDRRSGEVSRHDFDQLAFEMLPFTRVELSERRRKSTEARQRRAQWIGRCANLWSAGQLWWNRYQDLQRLVELRGWQNGVPEGARSNFLMFAALFVAWSATVPTAQLLGEVTAIAAEYCPTLPQAQVRAMARHYTERLHAGSLPRVTNDRIIEVLEITPSEQHALRWLHDSATRAERKRVRNRNECDRATYLLRAEAGRKRAHLLRSQGCTLAQIAVDVGRTVRTVSRWLCEGGTVSRS